MEVEKIMANLNKLPPREKRIKDAWLTVNRACNMNCSWCYANNIDSFNGKELSFCKGLEAVDLLLDLGIEHITILGGEPTLYRNLADLISYMSRKNLDVTLVTNGIKLSDFSYCEELKSSGVNFVSISIKGGSEEDYGKLTDVIQAYDKVMKAIHNMKKLGINFLVSFVLDENVIERFLETVLDCRRNGAQHFSLSFCYDFSNIEGRRTEYNFEKNIFQMLDWFEIMYDKIHKATGGDFRIKQSLPLCAWSGNLIKKMEERGQISYTCQVLKQSGIVFDPQLRVIPCNAMHKIVLGEYGLDFNTKDELVQFLKSEKIDGIFRCFKTLPSTKCITCDKKVKCRGGCISNWFNFTLEEFLDAREKHLQRIEMS